MYINRNSHSHSHIQEERKGYNSIYRNTNHKFPTYVHNAKWLLNLFMFIISNNNNKNFVLSYLFIFEYFI